MGNSGFLHNPHRNAAIDRPAPGGSPLALHHLLPGYALMPLEGAPRLAAAPLIIDTGGVTDLAAYRRIVGVEAAQ